MKKFFEILFDGEDKDGPGYLKLMAHLCLSTSDLLLICGLQVIIGFALIINETQARSGPALRRGKR